MGVRVNSLAHFGTWMESLVLIRGKTVYAYFQSGFYQFDMSVLKSIVNDPFIFLDRNRAS